MCKACLVGANNTAPSMDELDAVDSDPELALASPAPAGEKSLLGAPEAEPLVPQPQAERSTKTRFERIETLSRFSLCLALRFCSTALALIIICKSSGSRPEVVRKSSGSRRK